MHHEFIKEKTNKITDGIQDPQSISLIVFLLQLVLRKIGLKMTKPHFELLRVFCKDSTQFGVWETDHTPNHDNILYYLCAPLCLPFFLTLPNKNIQTHHQNAWKLCLITSLEAKNESDCHSNLLASPTFPCSFICWAKVLWRRRSWKISVPIWVSLWSSHFIIPGISSFSPTFAELILFFNYMGFFSARLQIEGAVLEDGKSPNNWDVFCHIPGSYWVLTLASSLNFCNFSITQKKRRKNPLEINDNLHGCSPFWSSGGIKNGDTGDIADDHYHQFLVLIWHSFYSCQLNSFKFLKDKRIGSMFFDLFRRTLR